LPQLEVTSAAYANGVTTTNTYNDARGWLSRVVTLKGATTLQDITYTRTATGRITSVSSANRPTDSWAYTYDTLDRLLSATNAGDATLSNTYTYDAAHNMLSNSQVGTYAYPAQGPSAVRPHAATTVTGAGGTYTLAYDANGNVTHLLPPRFTPTLKSQRVRSLSRTHNTTPGTRRTSSRA
jgi:YD repeat-containing protein